MFSTTNSASPALTVQDLTDTSHEAFLLHRRTHYRKYELATRANARVPFPHCTFWSEEVLGHFQRQVAGKATYHGSDIVAIRADKRLELLRRAAESRSSSDGGPFALPDDQDPREFTLPDGDCVAFTEGHEETWEVISDDDPDADVRLTITLPADPILFVQHAKRFMAAVEASWHLAQPAETLAVLANLKLTQLSIAGITGLSTQFNAELQKTDMPEEASESHAFMKRVCTTFRKVIRTFELKESPGLKEAQGVAGRVAGLCNTTESNRTLQDQVHAATEAVETRRREISHVTNLWGQTVTANKLKPLAPTATRPMGGRTRDSRSRDVPARARHRSSMDRPRADLGKGTYRHPRVFPERQPTTGRAVPTQGTTAATSRPREWCWKCGATDGHRTFTCPHKERIQGIPFRSEPRKVGEKIPFKPTQNEIRALSTERHQAKAMGLEVTYQEHRTPFADHIMMIRHKGIPEEDGAPRTDVFPVVATPTIPTKPAGFEFGGHLGYIHPASASKHLKDPKVRKVARKEPEPPRLRTKERVMLSVPEGRAIRVRALMDTGATLSVVSEELAKVLRARGVVFSPRDEEVDLAAGMGELLETSTITITRLIDGSVAAAEQCVAPITILRGMGGEHLIVGRDECALMHVFTYHAATPREDDATEDMGDLPPLYPPEMFPGTDPGVRCQTRHEMVLGDAEELSDLTPGIQAVTATSAEEMSGDHLEEAVPEAGQDDEEVIQLPVIATTCPPRLRVRLLDLFQEYGGPKGIFQRYVTAEVSLMEPFNIRLVRHARPCYVPARRLDPARRQALAKTIKKWLRLGIIQPSTSAWGFPVVMVKKKDGSWRVCVDFRRLNALTETEHFPLPRAMELLDLLGGQSWYGAVDMVQGYHQMMVAEGSRQYLAITTPDGHYEFLRCPFGPKNAPGAFQRNVQRIFAALLYRACVAFVDDIAVYGKDEELYLANVRALFEACRRYRLTLSPAKCMFGASEIEFLGFLVSKCGLRINPKRFAPLREMAPPRTASEVRSFLGLVNFFGRFVPSLSAQAYPLRMLVKKATPWKWGGDEERAFRDIVKAVCKSELLAHMDYSKDAVIQSDASKHGIGAVLLLRDPGAVDNTTDRPVAYASCSLTGHMANWSINETESYAMVWALDKFQAYVYGVPVVVETDHRNCVFIEKGSSPKILRWKMKMEEYAVVIRHIPGAANLIADALSRVGRTPTSQPAPKEPMRICMIQTVDLPSQLEAIRRLEGGRRVMSMPSFCADLVPANRQTLVGTFASTCLETGHKLTPDELAVMSVSFWTSKAVQSGQRLPIWIVLPAYRHPLIQLMLWDRRTLMLHPIHTSRVARLQALLVMTNYQHAKKQGPWPPVHQALMREITAAHNWEQVSAMRTVETEGQECTRATGSGLLPDAEGPIAGVGADEVIEAAQLRAHSAQGVPSGNFYRSRLTRPEIPLCDKVLPGTIRQVAMRLPNSTRQGWVKRMQRVWAHHSALYHENPRNVCRVFYYATVLDWRKTPADDLADTGAVCRAMGRPGPCFDVANLLSRVRLPRFAWPATAPGVQAGSEESWREVGEDLVEPSGSKLVKDGVTLEACLWPNPYPPIGRQGTWAEARVAPARRARRSATRSPRLEMSRRQAPPKQAPRTPPRGGSWSHEFQPKREPRPQTPRSLTNRAIPRQELWSETKREELLESLAVASEADRSWVRGILDGLRSQRHQTKMIRHDCDDLDDLLEAEAAPAGHMDDLDDLLRPAVAQTELPAVVASAEAAGVDPRLDPNPAAPLFSDRELHTMQGSKSMSYFINMKAKKQGKLWYLNGGVVIPHSDRKSIKRVMRRYHGSTLAGHRGAANTATRIRRAGFRWKKLDSDVRQFVRECLICQKLALKVLRHPLGGHRLSEGPWDVVAMDLIGPLKPDAADEDESRLMYLCVAIDTFTRHCEIGVIQSKTSKAVHQFYFEQVVCRYGRPRVIQTDQGGEFVSNAFAAFHALVGSKIHLTTPYHPQANGHVERLNAEVARHIRALVMETGDVAMWRRRVAVAQYLCNNTKSRATKYTPFELLFGPDHLPVLRETEAGLKHYLVAPEGGEGGLGQLANHDAYLKARAQVMAIQCQEARESQVREYGHRITPPQEEDFPPLAVGDWVWVLPHAGTAHKFCGKWLGPWKVVAIRHVVHVIVEGPNGQRYPRFRADVHPVTLGADEPPTEREMARLAETDSLVYEVLTIDGHRFDGPRKWTNLMVGIVWLGWEESVYYQNVDTLPDDNPALQNYLDAHHELVQLRELHLRREAVDRLSGDPQKLLRARRSQKGRF
eukprot:gnl/Dysnectes_brevis/286_a319_964.p1 GENE.gnl/Dysnectes_brevis/286_a319_964~~gnl/Dysnectes_brevis/286_a319_964.p1  ORF type:complete len:2293 (+),score=342.59 gnl/Dysnectes_brevis/286_a319_964:75-6953(+)